MDRQLLAQLLSARAVKNRSAGRRPLRRVLPRQQQPDLIRGKYLVDIRHAIAPMRDVVRALVFPIMPALLESARAERQDAGEAHKARSAVDAARKAFDERFRDMSGVVRLVGRDTADFQRRQLQRQVSSAIGITVPLKDPKLGPKLELFTEENVSLIKSIPDRYFGEVQKLVLSAVDTGRRWESLADELDERFDVGESRAALIARDQVGKFFGAVAKARQTTLGIKSYVWRTMMDSRVREEHEEREGDTFEWSSPPEDGHPGEPVNCRCYAEPNLEEVLDDLEAA